MFKNIDLSLLAVRFCVLAGLSIPFLHAENQTVSFSPTPPPVSSVQVINASSVDRIDLEVSGLRKYPALSQGARISEGAFPTTDWGFVISPTSAETEDLRFKTQFRADQNGSYTVVLIGDFLKTNNHKTGRECPRADILQFAHRFGESEKPNRVVVVNGLPKTPLSIEMPGFEAETIQPMKSHTWTGVPRSTNLLAIAGGSRISLPMELTPPISGCVVSFFQKGDDVGYSLMPQKSLGD